MNLTDMREVKRMMGIHEKDLSADGQLSFLITMVSAWIEEFLCRKLEQRSVTEYYEGAGTPLLPLKRRPVMLSPTPQCWVDMDAWYGSASGSFSSNSELTFGKDFCLDLDQDDQTSSRSGMLVRIRGVWPRAVVRKTGMLTPSLNPTGAMGSIKVTYTGGYTLDTLPQVIRMAADLLVARLLTVLPLGAETNSEGYGGRSIGVVTSEKTKLMALVAPMLYPYKSWNF